MSFCYHNLRFLSPAAAADYMLTTGLEWGRSEMEDAAFDVRKCLSRQGHDAKIIDSVVSYAVTQFEQFEKREKKKFDRVELLRAARLAPNKTARDKSIRDAYQSSKNRAPEL